jgi:hypothetical protein
VWVPTQHFLQGLAAAAIANVASGGYTGPLKTAYLGLCIAPTPAFNQLSLITTITEANYDGYARQEIMWGTTYQSSSQLQVIPGGSLVFQPSDSTVPNTITGAFIADALTAGNLLMGLLLPPPGVPLDSAEAALELLVRFGLDFNGNWGDYAALD